MSPWNQNFPGVKHVFKKEKHFQLKVSHLSQKQSISFQVDPRWSSGLIRHVLHLGWRDSGNDFRVPEIGSDNGHFSFLHVVSSHFSKQMSFLGYDFRFWSWLGMTRNENVKSRIKSRSYFACVPLITQDPPYSYLPSPIHIQSLPPTPTINQ